MKKDRINQIKDYGTLLALITIIATIVWQHGHDTARMDFLSQQVADIKESQNKLLDIFLERSAHGD